MKKNIANFELFVAKKIHFSNQQSDKKVSRPAVRIATAGITLGLSIMILAIGIVVGFKKEIREKVVGFGSHIQITNRDANSTYETVPVTVSNGIIDSIATLPTVKHVQRFATKPGIIKTEDQFEGVILKGIDKGFDWDFFNRNMIEGKQLMLSDSASNDGAIISKDLSKKLNLKLGDSFVTYFIQDRVRARKFTIEGIYETSFSDYDKLFLLADIRHIQKLNNWEENEVSGLEVLVKNYDKLELVNEQIFNLIGNKSDANGAFFFIQNITEINPQIFGWLDLLDMNVWIILALMLAVAGFNMISGLLIIIIEKANMIGILKTIGASNWSVRKIFLYQSFFLVGKGMIWGNIIGLSLCFIQYYTGIITLDPQIYYVSVVPISLNVSYWLLLNICSFVVSMLMLIGPSYLISNISPARSIRFE